MRAGGAARLLAAAALAVLVASASRAAAQAAPTLGAATPGAAAPRGAPAEECATCHPENRVAFQRSVHFRESVGCASCHGGDPRSRSVEGAHGRGFKSLEDRLGVPALCASCHSDLAKMRPYNLPVDQYAVYQTSQHGRAVAAGDRTAAVCTDCHGAHEVLPSSDAASSVNPRRLAATCGRCHADAALMERHGLDAGVVEDYRSSVHGVSLLERGNPAAPSCSSCHGVHGPTPPGVGDVDKVCGACHSETRRAFLAGPHREGMLAADLPECASCHSNHAIQRFDVANIDALCADCHGEGSAEAELGARIHLLLDAARQEIDRAEEMALEGGELALDVEDHLSRVEEARTYLTESLPLVHAVTLEPVEELARRARSIGEEVQHEIYVKLDRRPARLGLVVFWFYLLMTVAVLVVYKRRLARQEAAS